MSVIVKGMKMPKNCNECRFAVDGWCYAWPKQGNGDALNKHIRTNWCPLRPLPEKHGRLIDADRLIDAAMRSYSPLLAGDILKRLIDFEPTIVEAEG